MRIPRVGRRIVFRRQQTQIGLWIQQIPNRPWRRHRSGRTENKQRQRRDEPQRSPGHPTSSEPQYPTERHHTHRPRLRRRRLAPRPITPLANTPMVAGSGTLCTPAMINGPLLLSWPPTVIEVNGVLLTTPRKKYVTEFGSV